MKKKLLALPEDVLRRIARDYSIRVGTKAQIAADLTDYFRSYGLKWADVSCRYDLEQ